MRHASNLRHVRIAGRLALVNRGRHLRGDIGLRLIAHLVKLLRDGGLSWSQQRSALQTLPQSEVEPGEWCPLNVAPRFLIDGQFLRNGLLD